MSLLIVPAARVVIPEYSTNSYLILRIVSIPFVLEWRKTQNVERFLDSRLDFTFQTQAQSWDCS